jgi:AcrR family transcriptional regulator
MGAKPRPERKAVVLNAMADYLLGAGVSEASLRPAASALGTSPRMLLYHFRSKEALLVAALREVRRRETEMLVRAIRRLPHATTDEVMRGIWRWYASPRRAPYLRLFFEAWGLGLQNPRRYEGFLETVRKDLLIVAEDALVLRGYPRRDASAIATFMIAAFRGLLMDLVTNKDRARLDDAMAIFTFVTRVMEAKGPTAAKAILAGLSPRARRDGRPRRAARRSAHPKARSAGRE